MAKSSPVDDAIHRLFCANVRRLMEKRDLSLGKLADFAGIGRGRLSDLLAGKGSPTLRTMARIAEALSVPVDSLLRSGGSR